MSKQKSRAIPYGVYKKLFPDCPAHDYNNGKITVEFPEDYLQSKMYTPEGWLHGGNYVICKIGTAYGKEVWAEVAQYDDGGCKYYDATITVGNTYFGGSQKSKRFIRSFDAALEWAIKTAESLIR